MTDGFANAFGRTALLYPIMANLARNSLIRGVEFLVLTDRQIVGKCRAVRGYECNASKAASLEKIFDGFSQVVKVILRTA